MADLKTKPTGIPVADFINSIADAQMRQDCWTIIEMMQDVVQAPPKMWGPAIVGFGDSQLVYANGKKIDWMVTAFSPRKQAITLYIMLDKHEELDKLFARLGKCTRAKVCLYIKRLADVDLAVLKEMIQVSVTYMLKNNNKSEG
jgi:hypothetical protein